MTSKPATAKAYLDSLPEDRRKAVRAVRAAINRRLPKGYKEGIQYGMIGWFVPHSIHPSGYHCDPKQPVPFASVAAQKNYTSIYLMCIYSDEKHRNWFEQAWDKTGKKRNMGKSCIRFKNIEDVPLDLIEEAVARVPDRRRLATYREATSKRTPRKKKAGKKKAAKRKAAGKKSSG